MRRVLIRSLIVAAVLLAGFMTWTLTKPLPPLPPFPNPNGYDDLVKAAGMLIGTSSDWSQVSPERLLEAVNTNADAIRLARTALGRESRVRLTFNNSSNYWTSFSQNLMTLKNLGRAFAAEGRLKELQGHTNDAAASYMDAIRVGHEAFRGGTIIHSMSGLAVEAVGLSRLEKITTALDASQCRAIATILEGFETRREPLESVLDVEKIWVRQVYGLKGSVLRLLTYKSIKHSEQKWICRFRAQQLRAAKDTIALAARAYELEKGQRPQKITDLVPEYLKTVPKDPGTGQSMNYRP